MKPKSKSMSSSDQTRNREKEICEFCIEAATTEKDKKRLADLKREANKINNPPPEVIQLITTTRTSTHIRNLRIPQRDPRKIRVNPDILAKKIEAERESRRKRTEKELDEYDKETKMSQFRLLEKSTNMRMEQEYEIRELNRIIVATKYNALNAAKIKENKGLRKQFLKEEKELVEMEKLASKKHWESIDEREYYWQKLRNKKGKEMHDQIKERLMERKRQAEMKKMEGQKIREANERKKEEVLEELNKKQSDQRCPQEELARLNQILLNKNKNLGKDGRLQLEAQQQRYLDVNEYKMQKLDELRATGLPEIYYRSVVRRAEVSKWNPPDNEGQEENLRPHAIPKVPRIKIGDKIWSYI